MATDLTISGTGDVVTTLCVCVAVFVLAYLIDLGRRQRARERRRSAYAASWRVEYLVGHPLVPVAEKPAQGLTEGENTVTVAWPTVALAVEQPEWV